MFPTPVTSPNVVEFTVVPSELKFTMLKILFAVIRRSSARNSLIWIVLFSDMSRVTCPGPCRMLRPASPKVESLGFTQVAVGLFAVVSGWQKAAVLSHSLVVGLPTRIESPETRLARQDPLT